MIDEELTHTIRAFQRTTIACMATIIFCFVFLFVGVIYIFPHVVHAELVSVLVEWQAQKITQ